MGVSDGSGIIAAASASEKFRCRRRAARRIGRETRGGKRTLAEALVATGAFTQKAADMVVMADMITFVCVLV